MRLLTYNVHGCLGDDATFDPSQVVEVIRRADADIVALQEVHDDDEADRSFLRSLETIGYASVTHGPTMKNPEGRYGNVLMTRDTPAEVEKIDLSHDSVEPRGAIRARLNLAGRPIEILATHLGLLGLERGAQLDRLEASWTTTADPEAVRILIGDLNEWNPWSARSRRLVETFGSIPHPKTFPARWPIFRLDRVCIQPSTVGYRVGAVRNELTRVASDHLPLVAEIESW